MKARILLLILIASLAVLGIHPAIASPPCAMLDVSFDVSHACPYDPVNMTVALYNPNFEDVTVELTVWVTFEDEVVGPIPGTITIAARTGRAYSRFWTMPTMIPEGWMTVRVEGLTQGCRQADEALLEVREGNPEAGTEFLNMPGLGTDIVFGLQRGFTPNRPSTWGGVKTRYLAPLP